MEQVAKEPPTIKGQQFFALKEIQKDIFTQKVVTTPEVKVTLPTKLVTTKLDIVTARPTVSVARSVGSSFQLKAVTVGGKQFTTIKKVFEGKEFFMRSQTDIATGKTIKKVLEGDKLLKTIKSADKPAITFTEPLEKVSAKSILSEPGKLTEAIKSIRGSRGVSLVEKGKFGFTGTRGLLSQEVLKAQVFRDPLSGRLAQRTKIFSKIEVDLATGKTTLVPKSIEIPETRLKFVDFPPKQKPLRITRTEEGVFVDRPATILTEQAIRLRAPFEIRPVKRVRPVEVTKKQPSKVKKFFTPEEFAAELIRRKELAGVFERKLGREGAVGSFTPKGLVKVGGRIVEVERPFIELDPRIPKTRKQARAEVSEFIKLIVTKKKKKFIKLIFKEPKLALEALTPEATRQKTLIHELLHFKFPEKTEAQILRLESKTTKFKADNKAKEVIAKLREERRQETLQSIREQIGRGKESISRLKPKAKVEVEPKAKIKKKPKPIEVERPPRVRVSPGELKFFVLEPQVITRGRAPITVPLVGSVIKDAQIPITQQIPIQRSITAQKPVVIQQPKLAQQPSLIQQPKLIQEPKVIQEIKAIQVSKLIQQPKLIQQTRLLEQQRAIQQQVLVSRTGVGIPKPTEFLVTTRVPPPRLIPLILLPGKKAKAIEKPAFITEVREGIKKRDRFIEVSQQTLPRNKAINLGARITDNTTSRTFRIERSGKTTIKDDPEIRLKNKFRGRFGKSKLPSDSFVEFSKFAIDKIPERLGIPYNPIRIPRLREALARKRTGRIMEVMQKVKKKKDTRKLRRTSTVPIQTGVLRVVRPDKKPKRGRVNLVNKVTGRILFVNGRGNIPPTPKVTRANILRFV